MTTNKEKEKEKDEEEEEISDEDWCHACDEPWITCSCCSVCMEDANDCDCCQTCGNMFQECKQSVDCLHRAVIPTVPPVLLRK